MLLITTLVAFASLQFQASEAQIPIPAKPLGFVYNGGSHGAPIHINVYLDLACPDSKAAFPIIKQVADMYGAAKLRLKFFMFPLPYHRNAHIAAIGAQAAYTNPPKGTSPDNATLAWAQEVFATQSSWSDSATSESNIGQIKSLIASYSSSLGYDSSKFEQWLSNSDYDWAARVEWKYGCSRGVAGTPWYFINEVNVPADATWTVGHWKQVIDNIVNGRTLLSSRV